MKRALVILATATGMGMAASSVQAHHSHPIFYEQCKSVTIEGRVETVQWKDPHTMIDLKADDGTTYHVEWAGLRGLTRNRWEGPARQALVAGARVAVTGNPGRDAAQIRASFPDLKNDPAPNRVDPMLIRRADNSWSWAQRPSANPPDCSRK